MHLFINICTGCKHKIFARDICPWDMCADWGFLLALPHGAPQLTLPYIERTLTRAGKLFSYWQNLGKYVLSMFWFIFHFSHYLFIARTWPSRAFAAEHISTLYEHFSIFSLFIHSAHVTITCACSRVHFNFVRVFSIFSLFIHSVHVTITCTCISRSSDSCCCFCLCFKLLSFAVPADNSWILVCQHLRNHCTFLKWPIVSTKTLWESFCCLFLILLVGVHFISNILYRHFIWA